MRVIFTLFLLIACTNGFAQKQSFIVQDKYSAERIAGATVFVKDRALHLIADKYGSFDLNMAPGDSINIIVSATGYQTDSILLSAFNTRRIIRLEHLASALGEVVVTGTMKSVQRTASPVPVEVYTPRFFLKNPTPTLFDAMQMVNGVRPQLNCNVCNTGDIHINGLEGPYTMVLIDGMPIVSSLASVYGLSGIPNALVERIEVVKGPASSLYGSEAIGGLINVITKNPLKAPLVSLDLSTTSWKEHNADLGLKYKITPKVNALLGVNYFNYTNKYDENDDNFTDVTLQNRISLFNKLQLQRSENRAANLALRYVYEDRWGGEMQWNKTHRGSDDVYGEQIYTSRFELIGNYQLPISEKVLFSYSFNSHSQRSAYGTTIFNAIQKVGYGQLTWERTLSDRHDLLAGLVTRFNYYDDNTTATVDTATKGNRADKVVLPGVFVQDEISLTTKQRLLLGLRYDYDKRHGNILTPRIAYKLNISSNDFLRLNAGTGFRVVNIFTEDHAALTGARAIVIGEKLKPERSYNINLNYLKNIHTASGWMNFDISAWYTHFSNRIMPDYETDPNQIIYDNLDGYAVSKGISLNAEMGFTNSLRITLGGTLMDVQISEKNKEGNKMKKRQLLTENWTGTWTVSYSFPKAGLSVDYTGNIYGPMLLPLLGPLDPREPESPVWSIQNIQLTKKINKSFEIYGGVKNLLNWTPAKHAPFLISRAHDPFDKLVEFGSDGKVVNTPENPYALTFDPNYVYAPNQGMRGFIGLRLILNVIPR